MPSTRRPTMRPNNLHRRRTCQGGLAALAIAASATFLSACTVLIGPTIPVRPAPGRAPVAFLADRRACMAQTDAELQPVADRRGSTPTQIQTMYDASYSRCMASRGNMVSAAVGSAAAGDTAAPGLQDTDSTGARRSLAAVLDRFRRNCDGERIDVRVTEAALSPSAEARMVELTTPDGGNCFGQPGQNTYLVAKAGQGWHQVLSAEPGSISVLTARYHGYADLELNSLGMCVYRYRWNGAKYVQVGSRDCGTAVPPTIGTLPSVIRGRR